MLNYGYILGLKCGLVKEIFYENPGPNVIFFGFLILNQIIF